MRRGPPRLLSHQVLGQDALYRVIAKSGGLVELEVVRAPGLKPGQRVRFTEEAVLQMSVVDDSMVESEGAPALHDRVSA